MPTILITGAARGVGLELARQYLEAGNRLLATHRTAGAPPETLLKLGYSFPERLRLVPVNLTDARSVADLPSRVAERIDILVSTSGSLSDGGPVNPDFSWAGFERSLRATSISPLFVAQAAMSNMTRGGKIVTLSRAHAGTRRDEGSNETHPLSPHAINRAMLALATDLKPLGIALGVVNVTPIPPDADKAEEERLAKERAMAVAAVIDDLDLATTGGTFLV